MLAANSSISPGYDVRLFKGPAFKLAKAVSRQQPAQIQRIIKSRPALVNYQENRFGQTLLEFAAQSNLSISAKALLEAGANPNIPNKFDGRTPLIAAASNFESSELVRLLLSHGANPGVMSQPVAVGQHATTALIEAAGHRLESVKLLVDAGADINAVTVDNNFALNQALGFGRLDIVRYLILEQHADVKRHFAVSLDGDTIRIAEEFKRLVYPLESDKYQKKMELVHYLESLGIDYRNAKTPKHYYKIYSKDFLMKY